jgi:hypothetical protein
MEKQDSALEAQKGSNADYGDTNFGLIEGMWNAGDSCPCCGVGMESCACSLYEKLGGLMAAYTIGHSNIYDAYPSGRYKS